MAYRALYRAYRPQSFEDVAGQRHVTQTLKNAIKENRISHAYLFCGPRGTGKTSIAKIFAKAINCDNINEEVPCNHCDSCIDITNGEHPDIVEIDAASNNGVEEVRDLIEKVRYAPARGRYKVYIIDEVHMMSTGAFNALLKTLEEPPAHVVFILATTEPQKVLPTIISRCQRFDFTRISKDDIVAYLEMVLTKEGVGFEVAALSLIAQLADGGMRDSLSILEQCLAYSPKHLSEQDVNKVYGVVSLKDKTEFILKLLNKDMGSVLDELNHFNEIGTDIKRLTFDLVQVLKDVVIYKNTKREDLMFLLDKAHVELLSPYITAEECFTFIDILTTAMAKFRETTDSKIFFEIACMRICNKVKEAPAIVQKVETVIEPPRQAVQPAPKLLQKIKIEEEPVIHDYHINQEEAYQDAQSAEVEVVEVKPEPKQDLSSHVSEDDILNILVQADRRILNDCQEKWGGLTRYLHHAHFAKWATTLSDTTPVAACPGAVILSSKFPITADILNQNLNYHAHKKFLKELLGESFDYIVVTKEHWVDIRNNYLKLRQAQKLPTPHTITLSHIVSEEDKPMLVSQEEEQNLTEAEKMAYELFGDLVEIKED